MSHEYSNYRSRYNVKTNSKNKKKGKNGQFQTSQSPSYNQYNSQSRFDVRNAFQKNVSNNQRVPSIVNNGIPFEDTKSKKGKNKDNSCRWDNNKLNHKIEKHQKRKQHLDETISASILHKSEKQPYMKALNNSFKDQNPPNSEEDATDLISQINDSDLFYFDIMGNLSSTSLNNLSGTSHESVLDKRNKTVVDLLDSDVEMTYIEKHEKTSKRAASMLRKDSVEAQLEKMFNSPSLSRSVNWSGEVSVSNTFKKSKMQLTDGLNDSNNLGKNQDDVINHSYDDIFKELNESVKEKKTNKSKEYPDLTNVSSNTNSDSDVTYIDIHNELNALITSESKTKTSNGSSDLESVESQMPKNADKMINVNINKTSFINSKGKNKVKEGPVITQSLDEMSSSQVKESRKSKNKKQKEYHNINSLKSNNEVNDIITAKEKKLKITSNSDLTDPQTRETAVQMKDVESINNSSSQDVSIKTKKKKKKIKECEEGTDEVFKAYTDINHSSNPIQMSDILFKSKKKKSKDNDLDLENGKYLNENLERSYVHFHNELNNFKKKKKSKKNNDFDSTAIKNTNIDELVETSNLENTSSVKESIKFGHKKKKAKKECNFIETDNNCSQNSAENLHVNGQFIGLDTSKKKKKKIDECINAESTNILNYLLTVKKKKKKLKQCPDFEQPYSKSSKNYSKKSRDKKKKIKEDPNISLENVDSIGSQDSVEMLNVLSSTSNDQVNNLSKTKKKSKKSSKTIASQYNKITDEDICDTINNAVFKSKKKKKKLNESIDGESTNIMDERNNGLLNDLVVVKKKKKKSKDCRDLELPYSNTIKIDSRKSTDKKKKIKKHPSIHLEDIDNNCSQNSAEIWDVLLSNNNNPVNNLHTKKKKTKKTKKYLDLDLDSTGSQHNKKTDEDLYESTDNNIHIPKKKKKKKAYVHIELDPGNDNYGQNSNISCIYNENDVDDLITINKKKKKSKKSTEIELSDSKSSNMLDNDIDVSNINNISQSTDQLSIIADTLYDSTDNSQNKKKKKKKSMEPSNDLENISLPCSQNSNVAHITIKNELNDLFPSKKKKKTLKETFDLKFLDSQSSKIPDEVENVSNINKKVKKDPNLELTDIDKTGSQNSVERLNILFGNNNLVTNADDILYDDIDNNNSNLSTQIPHISSTDNHSPSNVSSVSKKKKRSQEYSDGNLEHVINNHSQNSNVSNCSFENDLISTKKKKKKSKQTLDLEILDSQSSKIENVSNINKRAIEKDYNFKLTDTDNIGTQDSIDRLDMPSSTSYNQVNNFTKSKKKMSGEHSDLDWSGVENRRIEKPIEISEDSITDISGHNQVENRKMNSLQEAEVSTTTFKLQDSSTPTKKRKTAAELSNLNVVNSDLESPIIISHLKGRKRKAKEKHDITSGEDSFESSYSPSLKKRKKAKKSLTDNNDSRDLESVSILFGVNSSEQDKVEPAANVSISSKNETQKVKFKNLISENCNLSNRSMNIEIKDSECTEAFEKQTSALNHTLEPCYSPGKLEKQLKIQNPHNISTSYTSDSDKPTGGNISKAVSEANRYPIEKRSKLDCLLQIVSDNMKKTPRNCTEDNLGMNKQMVSEDGDKSATAVNSLQQEKDIEDLPPLLFSDYISSENLVECVLESSDNCDTDGEPVKSVQSKSKPTSIKPFYQHVYVSSEDENEHGEVDDPKENGETKLDEDNCIIDEEHEVSVMTHLEIQLPSEDIPVLHQIVRPSKPTQEELLLAKKLNAKTGRFSKLEDDIIRCNWQSFCKQHNLTIRPSAFFKLPKAMSVSEKIKFLQYLSQGLDNRLPFRVFVRFQRMFAEQLKTGSYSTKEDKKIIDFLRNSTTSKPHHELGLLLNRTARSIEARVKKLSKLDQNQKIVWTVDMAERFIKVIMEVTGTKNVEDLAQISLQTEQWKEISSILEIPVAKLKSAWIVTIHPKLFETESLITVKKDLIKLMLANNETDIKAISWEKYAEHFEGMTGRRLNYLFNQLRFYVPGSKMKKDLTESLRYLSEVYVGTNKIAKKFIYHNGRLMICL